MRTKPISVENCQQHYADFVNCTVFYGWPENSTLWCKALLEFYCGCSLYGSDSDFLKEVQHLKQKASLANGIDGEACCEFKGAEKGVKTMLQFCPVTLFN